MIFDSLFFVGNLRLRVQGLLITTFRTVSRKNENVTQSGSLIIT